MDINDSSRPVAFILLPTRMSVNRMFLFLLVRRRREWQTRGGERVGDEEEGEKPGAMKRLTSISLWWEKKKKICATRQITSPKKDFHHRRRMAARGPGAATWLGRPVSRVCVHYVACYTGLFHSVLPPASHTACANWLLHCVGDVNENRADSLGGRMVFWRRFARHRDAARPSVWGVWPHSLWQFR